MMWGQGLNTFEGEVLSGMEGDYLWGRERGAKRLLDSFPVRFRCVIAKAREYEKGSNETRTGNKTTA